MRAQPRPPPLEGCRHLQIHPASLRVTQSHAAQPASKPGIAEGAIEGDRAFEFGHGFLRAALRGEQESLQRRRLAMARLLAAPRALWLLDEPLSPLDARWREAFTGMMARHLEGGGLILAAVHDPLPGATRSLDLPA